MHEAGVVPAKQRILLVLIVTEYEARGACTYGALHRATESQRHGDAPKSTHRNGRCFTPYKSFAHPQAVRVMMENTHRKDQRAETNLAYSRDEYTGMKSVLMTTVPQKRRLLTFDCPANPSRRGTRPPHNTMSWPAGGGCSASSPRR